MYQVIIEVDADSTGGTGVINFHIRTMADLSGVFTDRVTPLQAAEFGVSIAVAAFVREVLNRLPEAMVTNMESTDDFNCAVTMTRSQILGALLEGAADLVLDQMSMDAEEPQSGDAIDWGALLDRITHQGG